MYGMGMGMDTWVNSGAGGSGGSLVWSRGKGTVCRGL